MNLVYWGLWEDETVLRPVIEAYEQSHPNVKITYTQQTILNYQSRLQTQLRAGQGPDIFKIHDSWLPMFTGDLAPAPLSVFTQTDFSKTFYPMAKETLVFGDKIYAVPLEVDGLELYYNEELLKSVSVLPPKTWQEFVDSAKKITVKNQQGEILTSGAALGTTANVDYWPEIIGMLFFQQPKASLTAPATDSGAEVLRFYTSFVTDPRSKTWDTTLPSSTQMFAQGKLAFYFAPARQAQVLKEINPNLQFKTTPVPQLPGTNVDWGEFWVESVSSRSTKQKEAWEFLKYLSSSPGLQLAYQQQSQKQIGRPFSRVDMADLLSTDPILGTFISRAPYYKGWYLNSGTQDGGINDEIIRAYKQAVDATLAGSNALDALRATGEAINQTLAKYTPRPITSIPNK